MPFACGLFLFLSNFFFSLKKNERFLISRKLCFTESTWTFGCFRARACWNTNAFQAFRMPCKPSERLESSVPIRELDWNYQCLTSRAEDQDDERKLIERNF